MNIDKQLATGVTSAVGVDIVEGHENSVRPYDRVIVGVGYVGANAAGQSIVDVFAGAQKVFTTATSALGLGITRDNMLATRSRVPAGEKVRVVVVVAGTVNPTRISLNMIP